MNMEILQIEDLTKNFPLKQGLFRRNDLSIKAVDNISFSLYKNESLGLVGESGCGKSTTGRLILKTIAPTSGDILYKGNSIYHFNKVELRNYRRHVQLIFQDSVASMNPRLRISDIIGEGLDIHGIARGKAERLEMMSSIMSDMGLNVDMCNRYPHEFSGGQRQRIGIARALCLKPEIIVCDEPVSALDVSIQAQILNLMKTIQRKYKLAYIFISHDLKVIKHISERVAVMYLGQLIELCATKEIFLMPKHPYTKVLISVIPNPNPRVKRKRFIVKGEVNIRDNLSQGCRFANRCSETIDICRIEQPKLEEVSPGHFVACHVC
jgi:oligopeptide transport system ATP-binding protein